MTGDIRYYGLLKTIGVTPRQLKRIIRQQALLLCTIGCPLGLAVGWAVGYLLVPVVIEKSSLGEISARGQQFASDLYRVRFVRGSYGAPFLRTPRPDGGEGVSRRGGKIYGKRKLFRRQRRSRRAGIGRMALANLGRNKKKTVLVVVSLSLSVVLLAVTFQFTGGFSMEKYLAEKTCADFIVGSTDYFRFRGGRPDSGISEETVKMIQANTEIERGGQAWAVSGEDPKVWMSEEQFRENAYGASGEMIRQELSYRERRGEKIEASLQVEGMDNALLEKLTVLAGDIKLFRIRRRKPLPLL